MSLLDSLDLLIYLDEVLTKNLNSLIINGYIEKRTSKWIEDRTLTARNHMEEREQNYGEDRSIYDERDGYKGKNNTEVDTITKSFENDNSLEGRRFVRREEELTRIYTTFEIHQQLISGLNNANLIKEISGDFSDNTDIKVGDYVQISGEISSDSMVSYIDTFSNILSSIGSDNLNSYINSTQSLNSNLGLNYNSLLGQVNYLKDLLASNNSQDMIVNCGNSSVVLPVNNDNFLSSYGSIYDKMECTCKVIGKVIRVCDENQCIHLLRKTGQAQFYESLLNSYTPLKQILNDKGIFLPNEPKCKVEGKSLLVIPISLFI